ncbi:alpha/beta fold hydrolase [Chelativorans salis]|uniref:Alpha/beta hydrolase n=1 Tax=Chelativorans salis TaxID=2978478 RepID=A0ABT2LMZ7_9HYPH|nr:alpha/beta hydrolase [Chelativorans sp. EGI FJ00035]MCT7375449.1 alpha/beta hydrolase [Chelativorans sp. EGI FJ00035]
MQFFSHDSFDIGFIDEGEGDPVLLIHGFASTHFVNWVATGWVKTLRDAGYRVAALDNRGHGRSTKSHDPEAYTPEKLASDAAALLDHLDIPRAHVMGYSMGARITAFLALTNPERVATVVFGGLGIGMVEGVGEWDDIADALLAEDPATITHERGRMFRTFADQTESDREALAACISTSRKLLTPDDVAKITQPALVAVGTKDDIAGAPEPLADMLPHGEAFAVERRDHMLSVGDRTFKARVLDFLKENPL